MNWPLEENRSNNLKRLLLQILSSKGILNEIEVVLVVVRRNKLLMKLKSNKFREIMDLNYQLTMPQLVKWVKESSQSKHR